MDDIDRVVDALLVEQTLLRAMLLVMVEREIARSDDEAAARRDVVGALHDAIHRQKIAGSFDPDVVDIHERAAQCVDVLLSAGK